VDDTHQLIVVAIQGTAYSSNIFSVITDMDINRVKTDMCGPDHNKEDGCLVHGGFWRAMMDIRDIVIHHVSQARALHSEYRIVVTGHSLGGAITSLIGSTLRKEGFSVDIVCLSLSFSYYTLY
jgi:putative lipase involved disintegration of autophagic bodies